MPCYINIFGRLEIGADYIRLYERFTVTNGISTNDTENDKMRA